MDDETRYLVKQVAREAIREYLLQSREILREYDMDTHPYPRHAFRRFERGVDEFSSLLMRFSDGLDTLAGQGCGYEKSKVEAIRKDIATIKTKV